MPTKLTPLFNPSSVAVVGASRNPKKLGAIVVKNIINSGFLGKIYPVNPKAKKIHGLKCYPSLTKIDNSVDVAIVSLPALVLPDVLADVVAKGIKNIVLYTAGFKEAGAQGAAFEEHLVNVSKQHGLNVLGPNCLGFANNNVPINATFGKVPKLHGDLHFMSQSGAIATSIFDWAQSQDLGFSEFITIGNKAVINENDILEYWKKKSLPKNAPIGMYLESIVDGQRFITCLRDIVLKNPVFVLKPGRSEYAKKAMQSHTGALAGEDHILKAALQKSGVIRCNTMEDLFDLSRAFSWSPLPKGPNVVVVSNAGGPGVLSADHIDEAGLELAKISKSTQTELEKHLPRSASFLNPIDVLGDALSDRYRYALEAVLKDKNVHTVVVLLTPQIMTEIKKTAQIISDLSAKSKKPILCAFIGGTDVEKGTRILNSHKVSVFRFPERAFYALGSMWKFQDYRAARLQEKTFSQRNPTENHGKTTKVSKVILNKERDTKALTTLEALDLFKSYSVSVPKYSQTKNANDGIKFAERIKWPVVLKVSSQNSLHKKELGGIVTDINTDMDFTSAFDQLKDLGDVVVQKQVPSGVEVLVGVKKDPTFGRVLLFGAGGTNAELLSDRNLCVFPVTRNELNKTVEKSKVYKLLNGYRGDKPYDLDALYEMLVQVMDISLGNESIQEIEINPVIVSYGGTYAVDPKVLLIS